MKESVKEKYPNLFTGLGQIKHQEYGIKITHDTTPFAITVSRQVAIPLRKDTERELQTMERNGVISRVEDPTEWCTPMVVTPRSNGNVRVCVDLTKLNLFVQRENHPLPTNRHDICKPLGKIKTSNNVHNTLGGGYCFNVHLGDGTVSAFVLSE